MAQAQFFMFKRLKKQVALNGFFNRVLDFLYKGLITYCLN